MAQTTPARPTALRVAAAARPAQVHVSARLADDIARQIGGRFGLGPGAVHWRYWPVGARPGPICGWTTDRVDGVFWSFAAFPSGRGARSLEPRRVTIAAGSWRAHALRKDARAAAWHALDDHRNGLARIGR
jgi:hypothetical protein